MARSTSARDRRARVLSLTPEGARILSEVEPLVVAQGYQRGAIGDSPDGTDDLSESFVMYVNGEQALGFNLANDLGIDRAVPLDGVTPEDIGNADAVVVIGTDLANG